MVCVLASRTSMRMKSATRSFQKNSKFLENAAPEYAGPLWNGTAFVWRHNRGFRHRFSEADRFGISYSREKRRGTSVPEPEPRSRQRLFCRRHSGRNSHAALENRRFESDLAHFHATLQKRAKQSSRNREATRRRAYSG